MTRRATLSLRPSAPKLLAAALLLCAACASGELDDPGPLIIDRPDQASNNGTDLGSNPRDQGTNSPDQGIDEPDQDEVITCSPLAQDCPSTKKCVLDGKGVAFCMQRGVDRPAGEACDGIHQCAPGTLCVVWGAATTGRCETVCDPMASPSTCPQQGPCSSRVSGRTDFGLCASGPTVACDLATQNCSGGEDCVWRHDDQAGQSVARCGRAGNIIESAPCGPSVSGTCAKGLFCLSVNGGSPECVRACAQSADCSSGSTCNGEASGGVKYCVR